MKKYKVTVTWIVEATQEVEAESWEAACIKAKDMNLPDNGIYLDDSYRVLQELGPEEKDN